MAKKIKTFLRSSILLLKISSYVYKNEQLVIRIKKLVS